MPRFNYTAKDSNGGTIKGVESASNREVLADRLADRGLYLVRANSGSLSNIHIETVTRSDLVLFTSQLIPVVATGVPLLTGLEDMQEVVGKEKLPVILVHEDAADGA